MSCLRGLGVSYLGLGPHIALQLCTGLVLGGWDEENVPEFRHMYCLSLPLSTRHQVAILPYRCFRSVKHPRALQDGLFSCEIHVCEARKVNIYIPLIEHTLQIQDCSCYK
jgi:hypothetical protein